jgi:hypothetical protein
MYGDLPIENIKLLGEEKDFQPDICECGYPLEEFFDMETMEYRLRCTHPFTPHIIES